MDFRFIFGWQSVEEVQILVYTYNLLLLFFYFQVGKFIIEWILPRPSFSRVNPFSRRRR